MNRFFTCFMFVSLALIVIACGPTTLEPTTTTPSTVPQTTLPPTIPPTTSPPTLPSTTPSAPVTILGQFLHSTKAHNTAPSVSQTDIVELASGNSAFALSLYQQLKSKETGNFFYSPYSLSLALAMAYAGARGETEKQMAAAMHFTLPQGDLAEAFNYVALELVKRSLMKDMTGKDGGGFRLNVVNDAWGEQSYAFLDSYLDILAENYGAGLRVVDYKNKAEEARQEINKYISDQTEGRIKDLIPPGAVGSLTRLVLTNAIYFNAAWLNPFYESSTQPGVFRLLDGSQVTVPMMKQSYSNLKYASGAGYQAVELPYVGGLVAMDIIVPDAGSFASFQDGFSAEMLKSITSKLAASKINLTMPKFEFESSFSLASILKAMGMPVAFSTETADFSGLCDVSKLPPIEARIAMGDVIHKGFVSVDEAGTEAAAASAVIFTIAGAPDTNPPLVLNIDRPFIFLIRDIPTGAILFMGRVMNPAK